MNGWKREKNRVANKGSDEIMLLWKNIIMDANITRLFASRQPVASVLSSCDDGRTIARRVEVNSDALLSIFSSAEDENCNSYRSEWM